MSFPKNNFSIEFYRDFYASRIESVVKYINEDLFYYILLVQKYELFNWEIKSPVYFDYWIKIPVNFHWYENFW